jgi:hypothetical protein
MAIKKTLGGKKVHVYTKRWREVQDSQVRHVWAFPDGTNETTVDPSFYAENGTPICAGEEAEELGFDGDDMIYVRTEVLS